MVRAIAILLAEAYDKLYEAADLIVKLNNDFYNRDFRNGHPQAGYKRLLSQVLNQEEHYKRRYMYAMFEREVRE
jgi:hypothetical protein